jgi:hypothetical protein
MRRLVADLDSDELEVREMAERELIRWGPRAAPALHRLLRAKPSLESSRRAEAILLQLERRQLTREELQAVRAIEVLELIGTTEARHALERLARGTEGDGRTEEAKMALQRLRRRGGRR